MAGGRRNVRREEEEEYPDFASQAAYDDAINEHYRTNREFMRGFYPEDIRESGPMKQHPFADPELGTQGFPEYGRPEEKGMLSGAWDKVKGFGKHLAQNNPIALRFQEVQAAVDAYDNHWLTRLGHEGAPLKEDYNNEDDFMIDYKRYWDERPLDYEWFK